MDPDLQAAYERLEEAIKDVCKLQEVEGTLTDWTVVTASLRIEPDGWGFTTIDTLVPGGGGGGQSPVHRVMGLLDYALTRCRAAVVFDEQR